MKRYVGGGQNYIGLARQWFLNEAAFSGSQMLNEETTEQYLTEN